MYDLQIFSPILCVSFHFFWQRPLKHKSFKFWWSPIYLFFFFCCCDFGLISKKSLPNPMSWRFSSIFSSKNFICLALIFWVNLCIWCEVKDQFHSLAFGFSLLKRLFFPHWMVLHPCQTSIKHRHMGLFLEPHFCSIEIYVYCYAYTTLSWLLFLFSKF